MIDKWNENNYDIIYEFLNAEVVMKIGNNEMVEVDLDGKFYIS